MKSLNEFRSEINMEEFMSSNKVIIEQMMEAQKFSEQGVVDFIIAGWYDRYVGEQILNSENELTFDEETEILRKQVDVAIDDLYNAASEEAEYMSQMSMNKNRW